MLELKLAQYNDEGKFERFLELSSDNGFGYFGNFIELTDENYFGDDLMGADLDEKDPLNRFDGRFNGRTYGNGKYVLMIGANADCVCEVREFRDITTPTVDDPHFKHPNYKEEKVYYEMCGGMLYSFTTPHDYVHREKIGNLHEQPGLYQLII